MTAIEEEIAELSANLDCLEKRAALKDTASLDRLTTRYLGRTQLESSAVFHAPSYCPPERTSQYHIHPDERRRPPLEQLRWERGKEMDNVYEVSIHHGPWSLEPNHCYKGGASNL